MATTFQSPLRERVWRLLVLPGLGLALAVGGVLLLQWGMAGVQHPGAAEHDEWLRFKGGLELAQGSLELAFGLYLASLSRGGRPLPSTTAFLLFLFAVFPAKAAVSFLAHALIEPSL